MYIIIYIYYISYPELCGYHPSCLVTAHSSLTPLTTITCTLRRHTDRRIVKGPCSGTRPDDMRMMKQSARYLTSESPSWLIRCGGFHSHGGKPIAGWFISWKIPLKWMMTGGNPIYGNLHAVAPRTRVYGRYRHTYWVLFLNLLDFCGHLHSYVETIIITNL